MVLGPEFHNRSVYGPSWFLTPSINRKQLKPPALPREPQRDYGLGFGFRVQGLGFGFKRTPFSPYLVGG